MKFFEVRQRLPGRDGFVRSAGFQTCCVADFQIGGLCDDMRFAGLETRDTADLEVCATTRLRFRRSAIS
jgi:hypothetical protein